MKRIITGLIPRFFVLFMAVFLSGCFEILVINQPSTVIGGAEMTVSLLVEIEGNVDANSHYGIAGLLVPNNWIIDTVRFSGAYNDVCYFLHPDSSDSEPGGQVDYWADSLEGRYPSGDNMEWRVYESSQAHAVRNSTDTVSLIVKMHTGMTTGNYNIGYFVTDAALDFTDPTYYDVSLDNAVSVTDILPVELISFSASSGKNGINLKWETATETNNRGFEIQRSTGSYEFKTIGFVEGKGTTTNQNSYSFTDKNIKGGVYSYRLKQIDYDGSYQYSETMKIDFSTATEYKLMNNYPNPFNPVTAVTFDVPVDAKVVITLYNTMGEQIKVLASNAFAAGTHKLNLDLSAFPSGTYIYAISAEGSDGSKFTQSNKMVLLK